jgi:hypothetical protein
MKPGYLTTEFWFSLGIAVVGVLKVLNPNLAAHVSDPALMQRWALTVSTVVAGAYALSRGLAKRGH